MKSLYLTYDKVGIETGGGSVTQHESSALSSLGETTVWDRSAIEPTDDPFEQDFRFLQKVIANLGECQLTHCYAGCLSKTIELLRKWKVKTVYTAAAHSIELSRKAHLELGFPYDFDHLNDPKKWQQYLRGYKESDCLVVPSEHSKSVMEGFGCTNPIKVIPHGCFLPEKVAPLPKLFTVGNLGSWGPDKNLKCLLQAWKKLAYKDAILLLAGKDSVSTWATRMIEHFGGGNIVRMGWVKNVSEFYNKITCLVQPSWTEGFNCEVLESAAHSRPVICSTGTGAKDLMFADLWFDPANVDELCEKIDDMKDAHDGHKEQIEYWGKSHRDIAENHTWDKIEQRYVELWRSLL